MLKLLLKTHSFIHGTFGELTNATTGEHVCFTVECPWLNNTPNQSCVMPGIYELQAHVSPRFGPCLIISAPSLGVTKQGPSLRTHCLFHAANYASQLEGCIAPGRAFGVVAGNWAVLNSQSALAQLMTLVGNSTAQLTIERH
jgi:hypothetical protein